MHFSTAILTLAAAAAATPAPVAGPTPPKSKEFSIAFTVGGTGNKATLVSANAVLNGTIGNLVVVAERLSAYPGTPAYFNTSSSSQYGHALNFDLTGSKNPEARGIFGAGTPDVGDNYGFAGDVFAIYGYQQPEWSAYNGTISHRLYAAPNAFFACQDKVNGKAATVLKFGVFQTNGQPPEGCEPTRVMQNFNVPGGLSAPQ